MPLVCYANSTNYASLLLPIASAPCVTSVLRSLPAIAVQAISNRNWGSCDEDLSVQEFPTRTKYSKTFWGLPMTTNDTSNENNNHNY